MIEERKMKTVIEKIKDALQEALSESFFINYHQISKNYEYITITKNDDTYDEIDVLCIDNDPTKLQIQISTGKTDDIETMMAIKRTIEIFQFYNRKNAFGAQNKGKLTKKSKAIEGWQKVIEDDIS